MKQFIRKLIKKPFVQNVMVMVYGTAAAQVIALLASPFITRLYGPEAYGIMGVFRSTAQIIIPIAALTYPIAIVLPRSDQDAKGLMRLSIYISSTLSIALLIFLMFFNKSIVEFFNIQEIEPFMYLFPLVIFFAGIMKANEQWLIRTKQFKITARTMLLRSIFVNGSRLGMGFIYPMASVLVFLTAIENGFRFLMMKIFLRKSTYKLNDTRNNQRSLKELAKRYKDFPVFRSPQVLISNIHQNMPALLLTIFFGPSSAGFLSIGRTVLSIPSQLIGESIGNVFYPRISEAINNKEKTTGLIVKATIGLGLLGIVPYGIIIIFGPWLFSIVFGAEWATAGVYARWMAFWSFFMFLNRPSTKALPALFAQASQLKYSIFTLIIRLSAFMLGYYLFSDALIAIAFFSIAAGLLSIGLILITLRISKRFDMKYA